MHQDAESNSTSTSISLANFLFMQFHDKGMESTEIPSCTISANDVTVAIKVTGGEMMRSVLGLARNSMGADRGHQREPVIFTARLPQLCFSHHQHHSPTHTCRLESKHSPISVSMVHQGLPLILAFFHSWHSSLSAILTAQSHCKHQLISKQHALLLQLTRTSIQSDVMDPLFLTRPSNLRRLCMRPFQSRDEYKILFRLLQCFHTLQMESLSRESATSGPKPATSNLIIPISTTPSATQKQNFESFETGGRVAETVKAIVVARLMLWRPWENFDFNNNSLLLRLFPSSTASKDSLMLFDGWVVVEGCDLQMMVDESQRPAPFAPPPALNTGTNYAHHGRKSVAVSFQKIQLHLRCDAIRQFRYTLTIGNLNLTAASISSLSFVSSHQNDVVALNKAPASNDPSSATNAGASALPSHSPTPTFAGTVRIQSCKVTALLPFSTTHFVTCEATNVDHLLDAMLNHSVFVEWISANAGAGSGEFDLDKEEVLVGMVVEGLKLLWSSRSMALPPTSKHSNARPHPPAIEVIAQNVRVWSGEPLDLFTSTSRSSSTPLSDLPDVATKWARAYFSSLVFLLVEVEFEMVTKISSQPIQLKHLVTRCLGSLFTFPDAIVSTPPLLFLSIQRQHTILDFVDGDGVSRYVSLPHPGVWLTFSDGCDLLLQVDWWALTVTEDSYLESFLLLHCPAIVEMFLQSSSVGVCAPQPSSMLLPTPSDPPLLSNFAASSAGVFPPPTSHANPLQSSLRCKCILRGLNVTFHTLQLTSAHISVDRFGFQCPHITCTLQPPNNRPSSVHHHRSSEHFPVGNATVLEAQTSIHWLFGQSTASNSPASHECELRFSCFVTPPALNAIRSLFTRHLRPFVGLFSSARPTLPSTSARPPFSAKIVAALNLSLQLGVASQNILVSLKRAEFSTARGGTAEDFLVECSNIRSRIHVASVSFDKFQCIAQQVTITCGSDLGGWLLPVQILLAEVQETVSVLLSAAHAFPVTAHENERFTFVAHSVSFAFHAADDKKNSLTPLLVPQIRIEVLTESVRPHAHSTPPVILDTIPSPMMRHRYKVHVHSVQWLLEPQFLIFLQEFFEQVSVESDKTQATPSVPSDTLLHAVTSANSTASCGEVVMVVDDVILCFSCTPHSKIVVNLHTQHIHALFLYSATGAGRFHSTLTLTCLEFCAFTSNDVSFTPQPLNPSTATTSVVTVRDFILLGNCGDSTPARGNEIAKFF